MVLSDYVLGEMKKLIDDLTKGAENPAPSSLFSSSAKEAKKKLSKDANERFRMLLSFIICEMNGKYLNERDLNVLNSVSSCDVHFSNETILKVLNEILVRARSYSMMVSIVENREIINDEIKASLSVFIATVSMLFLPISWPTYIFGNIGAALGGVAFMEHRHPGIINACIDFMTLGFANAKSHNYFETIFMNDKNFKDYVMQDEQKMHLKHA